MINFCISLAGVPISVSTEFSEIREFCRDYFTNLAPRHHIEIKSSDITFQREEFNRKAEYCDGPLCNYSDASIGILVLLRKTTEQLLQYDVLLFHGVLLEMEGEGYLFTAESGTGKTTHARRWLEEFGDRARIINGDKPLLQMTKDDVIGYGTPWNGKERYGCNDSVPLKAVCILERGLENSIEEVTMSEVLPMVLQQAYRPNDSVGRLKTFELIDKMQSLRFFRLRCNMDIEAAKIAYEGMR